MKVGVTVKLRPFGIGRAPVYVSSVYESELAYPNWSSPCPTAAPVKAMFIGIVAPA